MTNRPTTIRSRIRSSVILDLELNLTNIDRNSNSFGQGANPGKMLINIQRTRYGFMVVYQQCIAMYDSGCQICCNWSRLMPDFKLSAHSERALYPLDHQGG